MFTKLGVRGGAVGWGTALQARRLRVRFPMGLLGFLIDYGSVIDAAADRNEYQEHLVNVAGA